MGIYNMLWIVFDFVIYCWKKYATNKPRQLLAYCISPHTISPNYALYPRHPTAYRAPSLSTKHEDQKHQGQDMVEAHTGCLTEIEQRGMK